MPKPYSFKIESVGGIFPFTIRAKKFIIYKNKQENVLASNIFISLLDRSIIIDRIHVLKDSHLNVFLKNKTPSKFSLYKIMQPFKYLDFVKHLNIRDLDIGTHFSIEFIKKKLGFNAIIKSEQYFDLLDVKGTTGHIISGTLAVKKGQNTSSGKFSIDKGICDLELNSYQLKIKKQINFNVDGHIEIPLFKIHAPLFDWEGKISIHPNIQGFSFCASNKQTNISGMWADKALTGIIQVTSVDPIHFQFENHVLDIHSKQGRVHLAFEKFINGFIKIDCNYDFFKHFLPSDLSIDRIHLHSKVIQSDIRSVCSLNGLVYKGYAFKDIEFKSTFEKSRYFKVRSLHIDADGEFDNGKFILNKVRLGTLQLKDKATIYPYVDHLQLWDKTQLILIDKLSYKDFQFDHLTMKNLDLSFLSICFEHLKGIQGILNVNFDKHKKVSITIDELKMPDFFKSVSLKLQSMVMGQNLCVKGFLNTDKSSFLTLEGFLINYKDWQDMGLDLWVNMNTKLENLAEIVLLNQSIMGNIEGKVQIKGILKEPKAYGKVHLTHGVYENLQKGISIFDINTLIHMEGEKWFLRTFSAKDSDQKGGTLKGQGEFDLSTLNGKLDFNFDHFRLYQSDFLILPLSGKLCLKKNEVSGHLYLKDALFHPEAIRTIGSNIIIEDPRVQKVVKDDKEIDIPIPPNLNLTLSIDTSSKIETAQIKLVFEGDVKFTRKMKGPLGASGRLLCKKGRVELLGKKVRLKDGFILFSDKNALNPRIQIVFSETIQDKNLFIMLKGHANSQRLVYSSEPPMTQEDILSYLLFNTTSKSLSPGQALQLGIILSQHGTRKNPLNKLLRRLSIKDSQRTRSNNPEPQQVFTLTQSIGKSGKTEISLEKEMYTSAVAISLEQRLSKVLKGIIRLSTGQEKDSINSNAGVEVGLRINYHY